MAKKIVLAFSGGLDTSYCAIHLTKDLGYEVHSVLVNTGGFTVEEMEETAQRARALGVKQHTNLEKTREFYDTCVKYLVFGNVLKNNTYPLSVSAERIIQARAVAEHAANVGAEGVAHGSTGAGNDQVRFDLIFNALLPGVEIITPIRDQKLSREQEIAYLKKYGVSMNFEKAKYSINKGIWGTSVGGAETLTSDQYLPEDAFPTPITKDAPEEITLEFKKGELIGLNGTAYTHPVEAIQALSDLAQPFGIGRDIHVGDTIIGIKGRVGFEAAAPLIIIKSHHLLEKHVLTKWQLFIKDHTAAWYGNFLHEGQYLDPVMRDIEAFLTSSQARVTGKVMVRLEKGKFTLKGIESPFDLMRSKFGQYGEINSAWSGEDVKGFTRIFGNQNMIFHSLDQS